MTHSPLTASTAHAWRRTVRAATIDQPATRVPAGTRWTPGEPTRRPRHRAADPWADTTLTSADRRALARGIA